jgi:transcriptional regulator with PAS, ATPase and Fis domain
MAWEEYLELHVVRKLRHIVRRRFSVELAFATDGGAGARVIGAPDSIAPCARAALAACAAAPSPRAAPLRYPCPAHAGRLEIAGPIAVEGELLGCAFAPPGPPPRGDDDGFLDELVELAAAEIAGFIADERRREAEHRRALGGDYQSRYRYEGIVGRSRAMQELYRLLDKVVESDSTVLIQGENGTGKELIARAIHYNSARAHERFVVQNCSAFNDNLLDSELFGHKRGAFTGAIADKQGLFEVADRGTFFLDEIGDMSPALQVKVLRVLQEGTFTPVGDTQARHVDVRIIAATNRDLRKMVERGEFREDLYYRVNVISLTAPPLRERRDDIPVLIEHFLKRNAAGRRLKQKRLTQGCLDRMMAYAWPGNVRELENEIERLVVLAGDEKLIGEELLSARILKGVPVGDGPRSARARDASSLPDAVDALERNLIFEVLQRVHWNKTRAAAELNISRRNLIRKVQKYRLTQPPRSAAPR